MLRCAAVLLLCVPRAVRAALPAWEYKGWSSFPAEFFGANDSGVDNATQLRFDARHQVAGWGWQVGRLQGGLLPKGAAALPPGYDFSTERELHRDALALRRRLADLPAGEAMTQGIFVYRQGFWADYIFAQDRQFIGTPYLVRDAEGRLCAQGDGEQVAFAVWDWQARGAVEHYIGTVVAELCAEARGGGVSAERHAAGEGARAICGAAPVHAGSSHRTWPFRRSLEPGQPSLHLEAHQQPPQVRPPLHTALIEETVQSPPRPPAAARARTAIEIAPPRRARAHGPVRQWRG
eukprot:gene4331-3386_t